MGAGISELCCRNNQCSPKPPDDNLKEIIDKKKEVVIDHDDDEVKKKKKLQVSETTTTTTTTDNNKKLIWQPTIETKRLSVTENSDGFVQLNQYKLNVDILGKGSYGVVKLAYNSIDDKHYAMKIISKKRLLKKAAFFRPPPRRFSQDNKHNIINSTSASSPPPNSNNNNPNSNNKPARPSIGEQIDPFAGVYKEIAILKKQKHPNVVRLVEVLNDTDEDNFYMVFELLERGPVMDYLPTDKPLSEETAWRYFRDTVSGLEYLHYQKIIHRDLKPSNLLLSDDDRVKISDFGLSIEFDCKDTRLRKSIGTPAFMAPEALLDDETNGNNFYDGKPADIWALGITLYCFVFGRLPFWDQSIPLMYEKIRHTDFTFPDTPIVSDLLKDLISGLLRKDVTKRLTLAEVKEHGWVTKNGTRFMEAEEINCEEIIPTDDEVSNSVKVIPKLRTLILVKTIIRKKSFRYPYEESKVEDSLSNND